MDLGEGTRLSQRAQQASPCARNGARRPIPMWCNGAVQRCIGRDQRDELMLPLPARVLSLEEIAKYWSREIGGVRTTDEIFDQLLSAFWLGELQLTGSRGDNQIDRHTVMKWVNRRRQHPGFTLIENLGERPSGTTSMPDGSVLVDITKYIILPSNEASWTNDLIDAALARLSNMSVIDFDDLIRPGFYALRTTRARLQAYCQTIGYALPRFWFSGDHTLRWNIRRENEAKAWFRQIAVGPKRKSKSQYFADALKEFPNISRDAFDRIWRDVVPPVWQKSGPVNRGAGTQIRS
jgi:hypothetical protein